MDESITIEKEEPELSITDHLTHEEALSFWRRNFQLQNEDDSKVSVELFCEAINSNFSETVFRPELSEVNHSHLSVEDLMQDFFSDLINKVSIDQITVSLNAFELFSRQRGLRRPL